jgi:hypothetical protein
MLRIKKIALSFIWLMLLLPFCSRGQQGHNVGPIDSVAWYLSSDIACDMIRVIQAQADSFKSLKGEFYLDDEQGNKYYRAIGLGLSTESKFLEVKASGAVAFVANWLSTNGDHSPMYALDGFTIYFKRVPEGLGYEMESPPVNNAQTSEVTYYMKDRASGKRVARFVYNNLFRESTFIVD